MEKVFKKYLFSEWNKNYKNVIVLLKRNTKSVIVNIVILMSPGKLPNEVIDVINIKQFLFCNALQNFVHFQN